MVEKPDPPGGENPWVTFAKFAGVGFEVAITMVVSIFAGSYLDSKFDLSPLFLMVCLVAGFAVALSILLKYSRMAGEEMKGGEENDSRE